MASGGFGRRFACEKGKGDRIRTTPKIKMTHYRLGRYFGIEPEFWMNLQTHYNLEVESERLPGKLEQEVKIHSAD